MINFQNIDWETHFKELKKRLFYWFLSAVLLFVVFFYENNFAYDVLIQPLIKQISASHLIATQILAPFFIPIKISFLLAIVISLPFLVYQLWGFIESGLFSGEKKFIKWMLVSGLMLFYSGIIFTYFIVLPLVFRFIKIIQPPTLILLPDISLYLDFIFQSFMVFGFTFETPILILCLLKFNILTYHQLIAARPYVIVGAFILGMLLTPPDVLSQVLLAIPLWGLFELGLWGGRFFRFVNNNNIKNTL
jgi:sec-independent protein translocase protein TatC